MIQQSKDPRDFPTLLKVKMKEYITNEEFIKLGLIGLLDFYLNNQGDFI